jgi:hypothetical protein
MLVLPVKEKWRKYNGSEGDGSKGIFRELEV